MITRDEIIEMAREAGYPDWMIGLYTEEAWTMTGHFAALVVAAEREACARMVDHILKEGGGTYGDAIRARSEK